MTISCWFVQLGDEHLEPRLRLSDDYPVSHVICLFLCGFKENAVAFD